jgi:hypothetical protein
MDSSNIRDSNKIWSEILTNFFKNDTSHFSREIEHQKFLIFLSTTSKCFKNKNVIDQTYLSCVSKLLSEVNDEIRGFLVKKAFGSLSRSAYSASLVYENMDQCSRFALIDPNDLLEHQLEKDERQKAEMEEFIEHLKGEEVYPESQVKSINDTINKQLPNMCVLRDDMIENMVTEFLESKQYLRYYDNFAIQYHKENSFRKVFNEFVKKSIDEGNIPKDLLESLILKVPKQPDLSRSESAKDFRPICLYNTPSLLLQRVVMKLLEYEFENNPKIGKSFQFAYRTGYGKELALVSFLQHMQNIRFKGNSYAVLRYDIKDAFLSVSHSKLIQKLEKNEVSSYLIKWIANFLTKSSSRLYIKNNKSREFRLVKGVPQGSPLGPILFDIFIDDFHEALEESLKIDVMHFLFADDIMVVLNGSDKTKLIEQIKEIDEKIKEWAKDNELDLNQDKFLCYYSTDFTEIEKRDLEEKTFKPGKQEVQKNLHKYLGFCSFGEIAGNETRNFDSHIKETIDEIKKFESSLDILLRFIPNDHETFKIVANSINKFAYSNLGYE